MNCSRVLSMTHPALIDELKTLVEPGKVLTDADSLEAYGKDWTKHFAPAPTAIVFPKTIEQVQAIVRWANEHKVALVPSGGRTGLSAAAVAAFFAMYAISSSLVLQEMALVIMLGIIVDIPATYFANAGILRMWMVRKHASA